VTARLLTGVEKNAIRDAPCSRCGAAPPFGGDAARCHPHRLDPKKGYVAGNVVGLCPYCHGDEHPGARAWIRAAKQGGIKANAARWPAMSPAERTIATRPAVLGSLAIPPERRSAIALASITS